MNGETFYVLQHKHAFKDLLQFLFFFLKQDKQDKQK